MNNRIGIRNLIKDLITSGMDIPVYLNRPHPVFLNENPCILIYFENEVSDIMVGYKRLPEFYIRTLTLMIEIILVGKPDLNDNTTEDFLDEKAAKIEALFYNKLILDDYFHGIVQKQTTPYIINGENDHVYYVQKMEWEIIYESDAFLDFKLDEFKNFRFDINKKNFVDNPLIASENTIT